MINKLNEISSQSLPRYSTGLYGLDDVLGGGIVRGAKILLSGTRGAGKSTLLLQISQRLAKNRKKVLYIAGEENKEQIKLRAIALQVDANSIWISEEIEVEKIIQAYWYYEPNIIIVDSLQMAFSLKLKPAPGTPTQMKNALLKLCDLARKENVTVIFVGHATKGGYIAGVQTLQHLVDVVMFLELNEEDNSRILKVTKNRFGESGGDWEVKMTSQGLVEEEELERGNGEIKYIWPYKIEPEQMDEICVEHPIWGTLVKTVGRWLGKEMILLNN